MGGKMVSDIPPEQVVGRFALGIKIIKSPDGKVRVEYKTQNENMPVEMVIMKLDAFLRNMKNDYYAEFDSNTIKTQNNK
jgi:hypothetical protein